MAIYYISPSGNDANNGLGPDASHASNKPWLTIGKALGAAGISSGDTVYIAPGVYRECVTVAMTSAVAETFVLGDPQNAQGFKDGIGVLLVPGYVRWTAYTTNDKTVATASALLSLAGRGFLTFRDMVMVGAPAKSIIERTTADSVNITIQRCVLFGQGAAAKIAATALYGVQLNWVVDQCIIVSCGTGNGVNITYASSATGADWDLGVQITRSLIFAGAGTGVTITKSGANTYVGGGVIVRKCTFYGVSGVTFTGGSVSIQGVVSDCQIMSISSSACLVCSTANPSEMYEDYNMLIGVVARAGTPQGQTNDKTQSNYSYHLEAGQSWLHGFLPRLMFSPCNDSPILGFGNAATPLTTDMLGRVAPSGPGPTWANILGSVGCLEFHDFGQKETTVKDAGDASLKLTGPGDHELLIPVNAESTTISIKVRYDTNHGTTNKPQATLVANAAIGVSAETVTATVGVDTWETLTFSAITPSAKGWVKLRLISRAAAGNGLCYFDTLSVA